MDGLKELIEAASARIKSPIFGSIVLAFFVINWQVVFYVMFSGDKPVPKFAYFTEHTTVMSLYIWPFLAGGLIAVLMPWVNYLGARLIQVPVYLHRTLQVNAAHKLAVRKKRNDIDMEELDAEYRRSLLRTAEVEQEIKDAPLDEDVREELESKVGVGDGSSDELGRMAKTLIELADEAKIGNLQLSQLGESYVVSVDEKAALSLKNRREYIEVSEAFKILVERGYFEKSGDKGVRITKAGYEYIDQLNANLN